MLVAPAAVCGVPLAGLCDAALLPLLLLRLLRPLPLLCPLRLLLLLLLLRLVPRSGYSGGYRRRCGYDLGCWAGLLWGSRGLRLQQQWLACCCWWWLRPPRSGGSHSCCCR